MTIPHRGGRAGSAPLPRLSIPALVGPLWAVVGLAAAGLAAAGCEKAATIELDPQSVQLSSKDQTATILAKVKGPSGKTLEAAKISWTSSAPKVVTVSNGNLTAVGSGEATITARADQASATARVRVSIYAKIEVEPKKVTIVGLPGTGTLAARLRDDNGHEVPPKDAFEWSSSHPSVVKVEDGKLTAVAEGTATITVRYGTLEATVPVEVKIPPFARVLVAPTKLELKPGETSDLRGTAVDEAGTPVAGVPLGFESSAPAIATVGPDGKVTAVAKGEARIAVSYGAKGTVIPVRVR